MLWVSFQKQFIISNPLSILRTFCNTLEHNIKEKSNPIMYLRRVSEIFGVIKHSVRHCCRYRHHHCEDSVSYFTWLHAHWARGKALNLYSGGAQFDSGLGYQLSRLSFSSISSVLPGKYQPASWLDQDYFLPNPFQFITHPSINSIV
jgi:hypothetical protein